CDFGCWTQAEAKPNKALELDPGLAEPHATLGFIRMLWEWRWADAEGEFRQAIELAPTYATAHQWYALWLTCEGRGQGAKVEIQRSLDLDPSSVPIKADMAQILYFAHEYDRAIAVCKEVLNVDPSFINAHLYLYQAYTQREMYAEAVEEFFNYQKLVGDSRYNYPANEEALRKAFS